MSRYPRVESSAEVRHDRAAVEYTVERLRAGTSARFIVILVALLLITLVSAVLLLGQPSPWAVLAVLGLALLLASLGRLP